MLNACSTAEDRARDALFRHQQFLAAVAPTTVVDPSDGISEVEAYKIGLEHFAAYQTACGTVSVPQDEGANWRVWISAGGIPVEGVLIRKSDGFVFPRLRKGNSFRSEGQQNGSADGGK
jgi:hypothetical protein